MSENIQYNADNSAIDKALYGGGLIADTISEKTTAAGVTVDGLLIKDGSTNNNYYYSQLATSVTSNGSDLSDTEATTITLAVAGTYLIIGKTTNQVNGLAWNSISYVKVNGANYGAATVIGQGGYTNGAPTNMGTTTIVLIRVCSANDVIRLGGSVTAGGGGTWRYIFGDDIYKAATTLTAYRIAT